MATALPAMDDLGWHNLLQFGAEPKYSERPSAAPVRPSMAPTEGARPFISTPLATPQIPTPPHSHASSGSPPQVPAKGSLVSISTTFFLGAPHDQVADVVLLSNDSVWFYVGTAKLLDSSENRFNSLLSSIPESSDDPFGRIIAVPESSVVLNIVLHAIYDLSCAEYNPTFGAIAEAISALKVYGVPLHSRLSPESSLFSLLMSHAPIVPLDLYTLAASYDLYDLAAFSSQYLHSLSLPSLADDMAMRMGAVYLKRLFFMHYGRIEALKRILLAPPVPHTPTAHCDFMDQKRLTRAWALASASLVWDARADISPNVIKSALSPLGNDMTCDLCRATLKDRIKILVVEWSNIKRTI